MYNLCVKGNKGLILLILQQELNERAESIQAVWVGHDVCETINYCCTIFNFLLHRKYL